MHEPILDKKTVAEFFEKYKTKTSSVDLMQLKILSSQDDLCQKCFKTDEMLCTGIRLALFPQETLHQLKPVLNDCICSKLEAKQEQVQFEHKYASLGIPLKRALKFYSELDEYTPLYTENIDDLTVVKCSKNYIYEMMLDVVRLTDSGAKSYFFYTEKEHERCFDWSIEEFEDMDFIHFEALNSRSGSDYSRQKLFEMVKMRISQGLATSVSLLPNISEYRNDDEKEFFQGLKDLIK